MKTTIRILGILSLLFAVMVTSCKSSSHRRSTPIVISGGAAGSLPPGQAKKVYGHKSAKAFAPGQQKKKGKTTKVVVKN